MARNRLTGCRCECPTCLEQFGSDQAFDRHRVGSFASPDSPQHSRRCLSVPEMDEAGWTRNPKGQWLRPDSRRAASEPSEGRRGVGATPAAPEPRNALLSPPRHVGGPSQGA